MLFFIYVSAYCFTSMLIYSVILFFFEVNSLEIGYQSTGSRKRLCLICLMFNLDFICFIILNKVRLDPLI